MGLIIQLSFELLFSFENQDQCVSPMHRVCILYVFLFKIFFAHSKEDKLKMSTAPHVLGFSFLLPKKHFFHFLIKRERYVRLVMTDGSGGGKEKSEKLVRE